AGRVPSCVVRALRAMSCMATSLLRACECRNTESQTADEGAAEGAVHRPLSAFLTEITVRVSYALSRGVYLASIRTIYRLLAERGESKERRNQRPPHTYVKPSLSQQHRTRCGRGTLPSSPRCKRGSSCMLTWSSTCLVASSLVG